MDSDHSVIQEKDMKDLIYVVYAEYEGSYYSVDVKGFYLTKRAAVALCERRNEREEKIYRFGGVKYH